MKDEGVRPVCYIGMANMRRIAEINLAAKDRAAVEESAALLRANYPIVHVVLFGSKARGQDDSESDIDVLVLTARALSRSEKGDISRALLDVELKHDVVISPLIVPVSEWEQGLYQVLPIRSEINRDGVAA
jgi:uncharacterized protein